MCALRSKVNCSTDESASMSKYFNRTAMSYLTNRYCVLFIDALGYDINGQAMGFNGNAIQMATVYDSWESNTVVGANISAYGWCGQIDARNEEDIASGFDKALPNRILGYMQLRWNWHTNGQAIALDASIQCENFDFNSIGIST